MKLENMVPPVYPEESRDYQMFLRAHGTEYTAVKNSIDTMEYLTDTERCSEKVLPLLKTKLGFFTNYTIASELLRGILKGFPTMIKNKGSIESIGQAVNIFLKIMNVKTSVIIVATQENTEKVRGSIEVGEHSILIGISSVVNNFYILEELFRYVMPAGYRYSFYFYRNLDRESWILTQSKAKFVIISNGVQDSIRTSSLFNDDDKDFYGYKDPIANRLVNALDLGHFSHEYYYNDVKEIKDGITMQLLTQDTAPSNFVQDYFYYYKKDGDNYVQLTSSETYVANKYYIPKFQVINYEPEYSLTLEEPADFVDNYTDYYVYENGAYRSLTEPTTWEDDKFYWLAEEKIIISADNVISYAAFPLTSTFISIMAELS